MTSTMNKNGIAQEGTEQGENTSARQSEKISSTPNSSKASISAVARNRSITVNKKMMHPAESEIRPRSGLIATDDKGQATAIEQCVENELRQYFDMLDGEEPGNLYRMVMRQAEQAVISMVMKECGGNQSRASEWLGISRGNLRSKLASMDK